MTSQRLRVPLALAPGREPVRAFSPANLGVLLAELILIAEDAATPTNPPKERHDPASTTCCGFAGDRGFLHPELTASATHAEAAEVVTVGSTLVVSSNRTCEVGLEQATGPAYESVLVALARATRPLIGTAGAVRTPN